MRYKPSFRVQVTLYRINKIYADGLTHPHARIYGFYQSIWSESRNARTWVFKLLVVDFRPILTGSHVFC